MTVLDPVVAAAIGVVAVEAGPEPITDIDLPGIDSMSIIIVCDLLLVIEGDARPPAPGVSQDSPRLLLLL